MTYQKRFDEYRSMVERFLEANLSDENCAGQEGMAEAMRYSALAGGKRIRPVLVLEFCRMCGGRPEDALPFAAALEMIHTYSLIHDDLPCMDDDDLRRGRPTSHKVFGEATAVLAGDALLTRAFEITSHPDLVGHLPADRVLAAIHTLSSRSGVMGMIGGQVLDMAGESDPPDLDGLIRMHGLKTGALICAAARIGCCIGGASEEQFRAAEDYSAALGLAFQIKDDMLDVEGDAALLGKAVGADAAQGKSTFPVLVGMEVCRKWMDELTEQAVHALNAFADHDFLTQLALDMAQREQ